MSAVEPYTNRLVNEKSPYLLQHAHNPVDWFPWSTEAFEKAQRDDKPIFLSIGYSTCHWCHVMEEESFCSPEIAGIMNEHFVAVKVDREERPDLDQIYMSAVMMMSGAGGWPLTVVLTPELKPFYGGTYFPPHDKWGRPGLAAVLNSIAGAWKNRRSEILQSGEAMARAIQQQAGDGSEKPFPLHEEIFKKAYEGFAQSFDSQNGGFGSAPKFPGAHCLSFLLRYWKRSREAQALSMVEKTLTAIAAGGIYDHIGGGVHRYATDERWHVPHFEKMLYDQAILSRAYLEAFQATGRKEYGESARGIFEYVLRDLLSPEGGFYCAEDADSAPDAGQPAAKKEGAFYVWNKDEIMSALGKDAGKLFCYHFGAEQDGNVSADPHGEFKGKNILYPARDIKDTASHCNKTIKEAGSILREAKAKLFQVRSLRLRPQLDDKILADWNGLMISSLAFGSRVFCEPRYARAAENAARFILRRLVREDGRLLHRYRDGESAIGGMIGDYAFFIHGLIDLYVATFSPEYLREAKRLADDMLRMFWDEKSGGGFFFTACDAEKLIARQKEVSDGALPSGNSIAALDLIRLGRLLMDKTFEAKAELLFKACSREILQAPRAFTQTLSALDFALGPAREIVISGAEPAEETQKMLACIFQSFMPSMVVLLRPGSGRQAREIMQLVPFLKEYLPADNKTTAYVCRNYICSLPAASAEQLKTLLDQ